MKMPVTTRRLSAGHFAALRAHLQGVDEAHIGSRYLYLDGEDARAVRSTLRWVASTCEALRASHPMLTIPIQLRPFEIKSAPIKLPSLDEFAIERGYTGWSQTDILAFYTEAYAEELNKMAERTAKAKQEKSPPLDIEGMLAALIQLQSDNYQPPQLHHTVAEWLADKYAVALRIAHIDTLAQLIERIRVWGRGDWTQRVRGLGKLKAQRIERWLDEHVETLGTLSLPVAVTDMAPRNMLAVFKGFEDNETLNGVSALNRPRDQARIMASGLGADNDFAAIKVFLSQFRKRKHTLRAYTVELDRLMLWALRDQGKALSDLTVNDALEFASFLEDPQPRHLWVSEQRLPRAHAAWRPFVANQRAPATIARSLAVARALGEFLVARQYWVSNPFTAVDSPKLRKRGVLDRTFLPDEWAAVTRYVDALATRLSYQERALRYQTIMIELAMNTGLRCAELVALQCGHLYQERIGDKLVWFAHIRGKGDKEREVPLDGVVITALGKYFVSRGLDANPRLNPVETPIVAKLREERIFNKTEANASCAMSEQGLYKAFKWLFASVAAEMRASENPLHRLSAARVESASTHWLRHSFATTSLERGVELDVVQELLGHEDINTTRIYSKTRKARLATSLAR